MDVLSAWGDGLSGLLAFMTQMALILLLGHALAHTRPVRRLLASVGGSPKTPRQAYVFVFLVAAAASLVTWGLGLVVGALLAKEVAAQSKAKGLRLHFPQGGSLTLDVVNWTFLALVLLLVRHPFELGALVRNAASTVGDILLQFPPYAGILGMMTASG